MISDLLLDELRDLAMRIAPELGASPLYLINQPDELPKPVDGVRGYMSKNCALMQRYLKNSGRWIGAGPVIVFTDDAAKRGDILQTLLHECAHLLPHEPVLEFEETDAMAEADREQMKAWSTNPEPRDSSKPPWFFGGHGKDFIRVALHLWWRLALRGEELVALDGLCGGDFYELQPGYTYWRAIGNEPLRMQNASFAEILETEPPADFLAWWRHDLSTWMEQNPAIVKQTMEAA